MSRSVPPPSVQRIQWCPWQSQGGQSHPSATQPPSRMPMAVSWALVKNRWARPTSRTSELPSRTTGMIRAVQASRRTSRGLMRLAGVEDTGLLQLPGEGVEVDGDDDGGVGAADLGEVLRADAFDELGERAAHPLRVRVGAATPAPSVAATCLGAASARSIFFSIAPCDGGQGEPAVDLAVAVVGHREPARLGGLGFFLLEEVGLVLVGEVGCDDLEEPPAEDPQGLRVVLGCCG